MNNLNSFAKRCPSYVHTRILTALDNLPDGSTRKITKPCFKLVMTAAALLLLFSTVWAINPALADGVSFRQGIAKFLGFNPAAQDLIEPPIVETPIVNTSDNQTEAQETKATKGIQASDYIIELDNQTMYDGVNLVIGYSVRRADGSPMPLEEEYTKDHLAGFIRAFDLTVDGEIVSSTSGGDFDWSDPYVYHQTCSYDLTTLASAVTNQSEFVWRVAVHDYESSDNTEYAELRFNVDTQHADAAIQYSPEQTIFEVDDFLVELKPILYSAVRTQITVIAYKNDDPGFGKRMDEHLRINVRDLSGDLLQCPPNSELASMGYIEDETGFTYMEYNWYVDPTIEFPEQIQLEIINYDTGEQYDPIMVNTH